MPDNMRTLECKPVISYASEELIEEVAEDIKLFGADHLVWVWIRHYPEYDKEFIVDYDFISEDRITEDDIDEDEVVTTMTLGEMLPILIEQNKII